MCQNSNSNEYVWNSMGRDWCCTKPTLDQETLMVEKVSCMKGCMYENKLYEKSLSEIFYLPMIHKY